jgi:DNA-binding CsgD family transcriptional regulator
VDAERIRRGWAVAALLRLGWSPPPLTGAQIERLTQDIADVRGKLGLSPHERLVLQYAADGHTVDKTAAQLHFSRQTIMTATQNARRKLGASNTTHAVAIALREGAIE